jgi:hypothetical protein
MPIIVGGNSDVALRRAARTGAGWYGFNLADPALEDHDELTRLGVDELVLVAAPPADPAQADSRIRELQLHSG